MARRTKDVMQDRFRSNQRSKLILELECHRPFCDDALKKLAVLKSWDCMGFDKPDELYRLLMCFSGVQDQVAREIVKKTHEGGLDNFETSSIARERTLNGRKLRWKKIGEKCR